MLKWKLARYLMDSKKVIDSLMFISENIENLRNLNIRNIIYEKLETFYVKIRIVYDKTFNKLEKKKLALRDNIYIKQPCMNQTKIMHIKMMIIK